MKGLNNMKQLVFSELYPDGVQLTQRQYIELMRSMTSEDYATHQAVPVCESLTEVLDVVLKETKKEGVQ
jgi:hypothetical protein